MFKLPQLPYPETALEPFLSSETLEYHYGKHHKAYIDKTNLLIKGTEFENSTLEEIILSSSGPLYNNASQAWNHTFYWNCMCESEKRYSIHPSEKLTDVINKTFGSPFELKKIFFETAMSVFGSGWVWLVINKDNKLNVISLPNGDSPIRAGFIPLLVCDVWEHAYYIDYRNNRKGYLDSFWNSINWAFVNINFELGKKPNMTQLMMEQ